MRRDTMRTPAVTAKDQESLVRRWIEVTVPDEVHHMPWTRKQHTVHLLPRRRRSPVDLNRPPADWPFQSTSKMVLFLLHIECRQSAGRRDHPEDSKGRPNRQGGWHGRYPDMTD